MNTRKLRNAAKILVACNYAERWSLDADGMVSVHWDDPELDGTEEYCTPFGDSRVSRDQADKIDDWLYQNHQGLLSLCNDAVQKVPLSKFNCREDRLKRMKWCLENINPIKV